MSSEEEKYYVVSETGFGGKQFRTANRFIRQSETEPTLRECSKQDNAVITVRGKSSPKGQLIKVTARPDTSPSSPKLNYAFVKPTQPNDFEKYMQQRGMTPAEITNPQLTVLDQLLKMGAPKEITSPEAFQRFILEASFFSPQNLEGMMSRLSERSKRGLPFRIGCFACLNMQCGRTRKNLPYYIIGQEENRLETPRISKRTKKIIDSLLGTQISFNWSFLLADTDPKEIYGDWLSKEDKWLKEQVDKYRGRLSRTISPSRKFGPILWSEFQDKYPEQYKNDFAYAFSSCEELVGLEYIQNSARKRLNYFTDKKVGLVDTPEIREVCYLTAKRNVASYAAQGPILNQEFDCLVIADPDPTRMGMIQSLLCPDLPIWYPYPG